MKDCDNDVVMGGLYRGDPEFALDLLNDLLLDGSATDVSIVLRQVALGRGLPVDQRQIEKTAEHLCSLRANAAPQCAGSRTRLILAPPFVEGANAGCPESGLFPLQLNEQLALLGMHLTCQPWPEGEADS